MSKSQRARKPTAAGSSPAGPQSGGEVSSWKSWWPCFLIAGLVLWSFWPSLHHGFVNYDDPDYVTNNAGVRGGLSLASIAWAFDPATRVSANWHPLTLLSHMLDCQIYGLEPFGHHLTSVLLHAANAVLLFIVLFRMTVARWRCLVVAVWFGLHPAHVESVAWVAERKDVLSGLFWMLTLLFYHRYVTSKAEASPRARTAYCLALAAFFLGLLAKPMLVTLPFVLLLLDVWPLRRMTLGSLRPLLLEKVPFFVLTAVSSVMTYLVQKQAGAMVQVESIPFAVRIANAAVSYLRYVGILVWPVDLTVFYPFQASWPITLVALAVLCVIGVSLAAIRMRQVCAYFPVGWFWFLGTLVPVIGLVQVGMQSIADRYTYLPSIGFFIIVAWGMEQIRRRWQMPGWAFATAGAATALACIAGTRHQIGYWRDSETLFRRVLATSGDHYIPQLGLGTFMIQNGRTWEAIAALEHARALNPNYALTYLNLGAALLEAGRTEDSIAASREATRLQPTIVSAWSNLARAQMKLGDSARATESLQRALAMAPNDASLQHLYGIGLRSERRFDEAIRAQRRALELQPGLPPAREQLIKALIQKGQFEEARKEWRTTSGLMAGSVVEHNSFGVLLAEIGEIEAATKEFESAYRIDPENPDTKNNLAHAREATKAGKVQLPRQTPPP